MSVSQILDQWQNKTCATYAVMWILLHMWKTLDIERLWKIRRPFIGQVEQLFIDEGLIKKFIKIPTPRLVDLWLKRWEYLLTATSRGDFSLQDNKDWLLEFDEKSQHFFIIIEDIWDKWKCQNSWGSAWDWDWCFEMKKSDFKYLLTPRRVIV